MMARTTARPPRAGRQDGASADPWFVPLARVLGRSSRFAADEARHLVKATRDTIAYTFQPPEPQRSDVRAGPTPTALVTELAQLVAQVDSASLERDKRFWGLVRELYSRRPWVPRRPRDLIETVGVEVKAQAAPPQVADIEKPKADGFTTEPEVERPPK